METGDKSSTTALRHTQTETETKTATATQTQSQTSENVVRVWGETMHIFPPPPSISISISISDFSSCVFP